MVRKSLAIIYLATLFYNRVIKKLQCVVMVNSSLMSKFEPCPDLTHYRTIPTFNTSGKESFRKQCGKRRKCWCTAFSPFPTMFSTLPKMYFKFSITFILLSANAFNLEQSKILSSGNGLKQWQMPI